MMYSGPVLPDYWSKLHFKENEQTSYLLHTSFRSHSHYGDKEPTTHFNRQKRPPKEQNNYTQTIFLIGRKEVEERAAKSLLWAAAHCPNWMRSGAPVIDRADFAGALKSHCLGKSSTHLSEEGGVAPTCARRNWAGSFAAEIKEIKECGGKKWSFKWLKGSLVTSLL